MANWVELETVPAPVISPPKRCSSAPKLETILEEGYCGNFTENVQMQGGEDSEEGIVVITNRKPEIAVSQEESES